MGWKLNTAAVKEAVAMIDAGDVDRESDWEFTAADSDALLDSVGGDWEAYGRWFLAVDPDANPETKGAYGYPHGKAGKVYRSAVIAAKARAAQQDETEIAEAAGGLLERIDAGEDSATENAVDIETWRKAPAAGALVRAVYTPQIEVPQELLEDPEAVFAGGRATFVLSTEAVDRWGDVIRVSGWELDAYLRNPVVMYGHDHDTPPVGRAVRVEVTKLPGVGPALVAEAEYPSERLHPFGNLIYRLVAFRYLNAVSVGLQVLDWSELENGDGYEIKRQELWEFSNVNVGANPEALLINAGADSRSREVVRATVADLEAEVARLTSVADAVAGGLAPGVAEAHRALATLGEAARAVAEALRRPAIVVPDVAVTPAPASERRADGGGGDNGAASVAEEPELTIDGEPVVEDVTGEEINVDPEAVAAAVRAALRDRFGRLPD